MPKYAKKRPNKEQEFQAYIIWKSMPSLLMGKSKEFLALYGFTDPLALEISRIKNQTQFAKKYHIKDLGTLTDWNKRIGRDNLLIKPSMEWAISKMVDVLGAVYQNVIRTGDAQGARFLTKYFEGWEPNKETSNQKAQRNAILESLIKIERNTRKIIEKSASRSPSLPTSVKTAVNPKELSNH